MYYLFIVVQRDERKLKRKKQNCSLQNHVGSTEKDAGYKQY
jgi:hypothetical protein